MSLKRLERQAEKERERRSEREEMMDGENVLSGVLKCINSFLIYNPD